MVTADYLEQRMVLFAGALRVTPKEFLEEFERFRQQHKRHGENRPKGFLTDRIDPSVRQALEDIRTQGHQ